MHRRLGRIILFVFLVGTTGLACRPAPRLCSPQDATAVDPSCAPAGNWRWDGLRCEKLVGCACEGADCDRLFPTEKLCMRAYEHCRAAGQSPFVEEPPRDLSDPSEAPPVWPGSD